MNSFIEPISKYSKKIEFGWNRETGAASYNMYVGLINYAMVSLYTGISAQVNRDNNVVGSAALGKVYKAALIEDVRSVLSISNPAKDFSNTCFWFAITYVDAIGAESSLSASTIVEVPPVGITTRYMKDDPSTNRHSYVFNNDLQRWVKLLGTPQGAMVIDNSDFYKANMVTLYTYDGTNVQTVKTYPSDMTTAGSPAKLTTYAYTGNLVSSIIITDSTV